MRALPVLLALAAAALSGCFWWDGMGMGGSDSGDPEFAFVLLAVLMLVGVVLLAMNLSQPGPRPPPPQPPQPPAPPTPSKDDGWQEVHAAPTPDPPATAKTATKKATSKSSKPRRRSP